MNTHPLDMQQNDVDSLIKMIKSLFGPSIDRFVRKNRYGYLENSIIFDDVKSDVIDSEYDYAINNLLVDNLEGLEIVEESNYCTSFSYNGIEILMCQHINIAHNSIYFVFSLVNKKDETSVVKPSNSNDLDC
jgi:hypothetical protein